MSKVALEIAVTSPQGASVALAGGADRVELCAALEVGGVTPSQALVEAAVAVGLPVHVLVRCRPGDFVYDPDEVALMEREVAHVLAAGAAGVVVGALQEDGTLDEVAVRRLVDTARVASTTAEVTLHRAIDHAADPVATAGTLRGLGLSRVLTSGGAPTAAAGRDVIARMVEAAPGLRVMAGAGVTPADIPVLLTAGVAAVHLSAKRVVPARSRPDGPPMGAADSGTGHLVTDGGIVRAARAALQPRVPPGALRSTSSKACRPGRTEAGESRGQQGQQRR